MRYRRRESCCSLWSRNNQPHVEGIFAGEPSEQEVDEDGYKDGCPSSFSSAAAMNSSGGPGAAAVYG